MRVSLVRLLDAGKTRSRGERDGLVFCPRPNSSACRAQVMSSVWLRIGLRVNGSVNDRLNRAFRAPFTLSAASHVRKALEGLVEVSKLLLCAGCLVMWVHPCVSAEVAWVTIPSQVWSTGARLSRQHDAGNPHRLNLAPVVRGKGSQVVSTRLGSCFWRARHSSLSLPIHRWQNNLCRGRA